MVEKQPAATAVTIQKKPKKISHRNFETYDEPGKAVHSLVGKCVFCKIAAGLCPDLVLFEVINCNV